jgi:hypothetical protein
MIKFRWEMEHHIRGVAVEPVSTLFTGRSCFDTREFNLSVIGCFSDNTHDTI